MHSPSIPELTKWKSDHDISCEFRYSMVYQESFKYRLFSENFILNFFSGCVIIFTINNHVLITKEREIAT